MNFARKVLRFNEKTTRDSDRSLDQNADIRKIQIVKSPNVRKAWEVAPGSKFLPAALDDDAAAIGKPDISGNACGNACEWSAIRQCMRGRRGDYSQTLAYLGN